MRKLTVANQKGGVAKTSTTVVIAEILARQGQRVLLVDLDPQGSIASTIPAQPSRFLFDLVVAGVPPENCICRVKENIDAICSNRQTAQLESILMSSVAREQALRTVFSKIEKSYDYILFDVSPSISLLQTCALVYTQCALIPVAMDTLSVQGAIACIETIKTLNQLLRADIELAGILPVMVDRRTLMSSVVLRGLNDLTMIAPMTLLPAIRTDATVPKAARMRQFLGDFDRGSKAFEDYVAMVEKLTPILEKGPHAAESATL